MNRTKVLVCALALTLTGLAATGSAGAESAGAAPPVAAPEAPDTAFAWQLVRPGQANAPAEHCRDLPPGPGTDAYMCSAFGIDSDGNAYGYYRVTVTGQTFVQGRLNNNNNAIFNLVTRPDARGIFAHVQSLDFRACNSLGCGGWG